MWLNASTHRADFWHNSWYGIVGFNVPLDTFRSFRRRFYRSDDPINSVIALKDDSITVTTDNRYLYYIISNGKRGLCELRAALR